MWEEHLSRSDLYELLDQAYRAFYLRPSRLWQIFKLIPNKRAMLPYLAVLFAQRAYSR